MRREKTMKICANFFTSPSIELKENMGSDRSWVWQCMDFAEEKEEVSVLAIRFANAENAHGEKIVTNRETHRMTMREPLLLTLA